MNTLYVQKIAMCQVCNLKSFFFVGGGGGGVKGIGSKDIKKRRLPHDN